MTDNSPNSDRSPNLNQVPARLVTGPIARHTSGASGPGMAPPSAGVNITPAFVWQVFRRWWKWIIPTGVVLATIAAATVWNLWVPAYEAVALINIQSDVPFIAFDKTSSQGEGEKYVQTQIEMLRSQVVLGPVLASPEIAAIPEIQKQRDPLKYMQKELSISQVGKSELYGVRYRSPSAPDAARVVNKIVAEYMAMQNRNDERRWATVIRVLKSELTQREANVQQKLADVVRKSKDLTGRDPFDKTIVIDPQAFSTSSSLSQRLTEANVQVQVLEFELRALANELKTMRDTPVEEEAKGISTLQMEVEIANRPEIQKLNAELAAIEDDLMMLESRPSTKRGHSPQGQPEYVALLNLSKEKKDKLALLTQTARENFAQLKRAQREAEQQQLIRDKSRVLSSLTATRDLLQEKFNEELAEMKQGGGESAGLEFAKAELAREQRIVELVSARILELETEKSAPERVISVQDALTPTLPVEPIPLKQLALACLASLVAPFGLALAYELVARRVNSADQLRSESHLPVLGEIARFPTRVISHTQQALPLRKQRELSVYAESIDSLRTNLRLTAGVGMPGCKRVIAVCSAASGEGKTSVSTALAVSIAEASQQPTLIIDADLRDPDVNTLLTVPRVPGMAEVLSGRAKIEEAIHQVGDTQTFVLPAGKCRVNPHHLLQGPAIEDLLGSLRARFETIVVDTPPVLSASESLVYAVAADLVIFCSLADVSRCKPVQMALDRLQTTGANVAGVVLNGVAAKQYAYNYGTYARPDVE